MSKILHIIGSVNLSQGGPIHGIINLNYLYKKEGKELDILCFESFSNHSDLFNDINIIKLKSFKLFNYHYSSELHDWLKENAHNYSRIIINGIWQYSSYGSYRCLNKLKIGYEIFTHGMLDPWSIRNNLFKRIKKTIYFYFFEYFVLKNAKYVCFTSAEEKRLALNSFLGIKLKAKLVNYGIPAPILAWKNSSLFVKKYPLIKNKKVILFLSRVHPKKGLNLLITAFAILYKDKKDIILVVAGSGDISYMNSLIKLSKNLGISNKIIWTGMLVGELKWSAFNSSNIFCLPSHQENFGIVIPEALSTGLPVIISNKVNIYSDIFNYNAGIVIEDDLEGVINGLCIWNNSTKDQLLDFKKNAIKCFEEKFRLY